jgi:hypothetical protein
MASDSELERRAKAAWFRSGGEAEPGAESGVVAHGGLTYVVLRNVSGILAVYRVKNDGLLRRLRRWPASLE